MNNNKRMKERDEKRRKFLNEWMKKINLKSE